MNRHDREIMQLCQDVIVLDSDVDDGAPDLSEMAQQAGRILERLRRPALRSPAAGMRGERARAQKDDAAVQLQQFKTEQLRDAAIQRAFRAGCVGELCGKPLNLHAAEMAHLEGGNGRKHEKQWIGNVAMEHPECHRIGPKSLDAAPKLWIGQVKAFCRRNGYRLPARWRAIEAKLEMTCKLKEGK